jgi:hypothetical protein
VGPAEEQQVDELLRAVAVGRDQRRREVGVALHHRDAAREQ